MRLWPMYNRQASKWNCAEMLRLIGKLLPMRDRAATAEAEKSLRAALEVARAQEAKWWELRTSISLARQLREAGIATKPARCSPRSTTGSPKASIPSI